MVRSARTVLALSAGWLLLALGLAASAAAQDLDFERQRALMMLDATASNVEKNFYDPQLKGLDWKGLVEVARQRIRSARSVNAIYSAIFALVDQLNDSHTKFLPPSRAARIRFGFDAKPFGEKVLIYEMRKKGAAEAAGLQLGDQLLVINGFKVERATFDAMMLYLRVLSPVTAMDLVVKRGSDPPRAVRVEADVQPEALVEDLTRIDNIYKLIREDQAEREKALHRVDEDGIGYLFIPHFGVSPEKITSLVEKIEKARAAVLDLRDNPGGRVDTLTTFVGHFEPEPTVIGDTISRKKTEPMKVKPRKPNLNIPLFILVDSESSSAAEVVPRHLQLAGRAVVIGDRTSGRVTAARFYVGHIGTETVTLYGVSVAVERLVFPDGQELEGRGVTPDHICVPTPDDLREKRDPCLGLALRLAAEKLGSADKAPSGDTEKKN